MDPDPQVLGSGSRSEGLKLLGNINWDKFFWTVELIVELR